MVASTLFALALAPAPADAADARSLDEAIAVDQAFTPNDLGGGYAVVPAASSSDSGKHRIPALAFGLNFFVPGAGYLYNGEKPVYVSLPMIAGAAGLTYVEQIHPFENGNLLETDSTAFAVMFGAVFALNTGLAIDAFREAQAINGTGQASRAKKRPSRSLAVAPRSLPAVDGPAYGVGVDARF